MTDELPREVSRATMQVGDCEVEVVHLDNGQRIITAESMERLFAYMETGGLDLRNVTPSPGEDHSPLKNKEGDGE